MKTIFLILFISICSGVYAIKCYFVASTNDVQNGTSTSTSFKIISRLNSYFGSLKADYNALFNREDITAHSVNIFIYETLNTGDFRQNALSHFFQQFQIQSDINNLDPLNKWYHNHAMTRLDAYKTYIYKRMQLATIGICSDQTIKSYINISTNLIPYKRCS